MTDLTPGKSWKFSSDSSSFSVSHPHPIDWKREAYLICARKSEKRRGMDIIKTSSLSRFSFQSSSTGIWNIILNESMSHNGREERKRRKRRTMLSLSFWFSRSKCFEKQESIVGKVVLFRFSSQRKGMKLTVESSVKFPYNEHPLSSF